MCEQFRLQILGVDAGKVCIPLNPSSCPSSEKPWQPLPSSTSRTAKPWTEKQKKTLNNKNVEWRYGRTRQRSAGQTHLYDQVTHARARVGLSGWAVGYSHMWGGVNLPASQDLGGVRPGQGVCGVWVKLGRWWWWADATYYADSAADKHDPLWNTFTMYWHFIEVVCSLFK